MRRGRRRRRVSLRGWWRVLPFVGLAGATFFVSTWLHAQRLHNEYRAIELTAEIDRVKDRIADLYGERYRLERMDRISEVAPQHALIQRKPGQVQVLQAGPEDIRAFAIAARPPVKPARSTRSVVLILDVPVPQTEETAPETAMAQTKPPARGEAPENL
jgi:hypothetical protein